MKQNLSKEEVQKLFQQLVNARQRSKDYIVTKEEKARKEQERQLVESSAKQTPKAIIKGLADLQLDFSSTLEKLAQQASDELKRLSDLQTAIQVQQSNLKKTEDIKVAANALYILQQEQAQKDQKTDEEHNNVLEELSKEQTTSREQWSKEQSEFETREAEYKANLDKERQRELEEYRYQLERKYKLEQDDYEQRKTLLQRELTEKQRERDKNWTLREKTLAENKAEFEKHKQKVDNFEADSTAAANTAREKMMQQTSRDCKEEMEFYQKEVEGKKKMAQLQMENLQRLIENQKAELERLSKELAQAQTEVRTVSLSALNNSNAW